MVAKAKPQAETQTSSGGGARRQSDRSAAMRTRLLSAAIDCLEREGYAATTLQKVTDIAGVSRGAVLYHFPTRVDLMLATAQFASEWLDRIAADMLVDIESGLSRLLAVTDAVWSAIQQAPGVALSEIVIGSRSDPALRERFLELLTKMEQRGAEHVWMMAREVGIKDEAGLKAVILVQSVAIGGIAMKLNVTRDQAAAEVAMSLIRKTTRLMIGALLVLPYEGCEGMF